MAQGIVIVIVQQLKDINNYRLCKFFHIDFDLLFNYSKLQ